MAHTGVRLFLLDEGVAADVGRVLRTAGHRVESVQAVGLSGAEDDAVSVWADDHRAILLTHDREFTRRRKRDRVGLHVQLRCDEFDAADLVAARLGEMLELLRSGGDVTLVVSRSGIARF